MASIFKQKYTRRGITRESKNWYIESVDVDGKTQRVAGYPDRQATQHLGAAQE